MAMVEAQGGGGAPNKTQEDRDRQDNPGQDRVDGSKLKRSGWDAIEKNANPARVVFAIRFAELT